MVIRYKTQLIVEKQSAIREGVAVLFGCFPKVKSGSTNNAAESCYCFLIMAISNW